MNKKLYAATIDSFPAAQTLMAASICGLGGLTNLALFTKRKTLIRNAEEIKEKQMRLEEQQRSQQQQHYTGEDNYGIHMEEKY